MLFFILHVSITQAHWNRGDYVNRTKTQNVTVNRTKKAINRSQPQQKGTKQIWFITVRFDFSGDEADDANDK